MEYVYSMLLLHKVGQEITIKAMEDILKAADIEPDKNRIGRMCAAFKGVDLDGLLKNVSMFKESAVLVEAMEAVEEVEEEEEEEQPAGLSALFG
jgi:ribosomal protein L12E/L44/L45/RPP1/RPP2